MEYSENKNKWTTTTHNMDEYHNIMLSKRSQTQKITYWSIPFMDNIKTGKLTYAFNSQDSGCLRGGGVRNQKRTQEGF